MAIVVPNTAEVLMLKYIVNVIGQDGGTAPAGGNRLLHLFTNNVTPGPTTALTDLLEATAAGYAPITLTGTSWSTTITNGAGLATYSQQIFNFTTGVTLYGYYVTTLGTPQLMWVEVFTNAPFILPDGGGQVGVSPQFSMTNP